MGEKQIFNIGLFRVDLDNIPLDKQQEVLQELVNLNNSFTVAMHRIIVLLGGKFV